jgi:hypothetical protein
MFNGNPMIAFPAEDPIKRIPLLMMKYLRTGTEIQEKYNPYYSVPLSVTQAFLFFVLVHEKNCAMCKDGLIRCVVKYLSHPALATRLQNKNPSLSSFSTTFV